MLCIKLICVRICGRSPSDCHLTLTWRVKSAFRGNRGHFHYARRHSANKIFSGVRNGTEMVNINTIISHVNKVRRRHLSRLQTHQRQPGFQEHLSPAGKVCVLISDTCKRSSNDNRAFGAGQPCKSSPKDCV